VRVGTSRTRLIVSRASPSIIGEQQFTLKAVAMYKKIDRLNPRNPEIAEKLATLSPLRGWSLMRARNT